MTRLADEPLIHTLIGNVPVASLSHSVEWRITDKIIHFSETYTDASGEIVRQDAHVYSFGADALSDASITE